MNLDTWQLLLDFSCYCGIGIVGFITFCVIYGMYIEFFGEDNEDG